VRRPEIQRAVTIWCQQYGLREGFCDPLYQREIYFLVGFFRLQIALAGSYPTLRVQAPRELHVMSQLLALDSEYVIGRPKVAVVIDDASGAREVSGNQVNSPFLELLVARRHLNIYYMITIVHAPSFVFGRAKTQINNFVLFDGIEPYPLREFLVKNVPLRSAHLVGVGDLFELYKRTMGDVEEQERDDAMRYRWIRITTQPSPFVSI